MSSPKAKANKPAEVVKIKVLRSHPELSYHPGETGELSAQKAADLIAGGFIEEAPKTAE